MSDQPSNPQAVTFDTVREIARTFPGVEEGTAYGTPAFRVRKKFLSRLKEDGDSLVLKMDFMERQYLLENKPDIYYITEHFIKWPYVMVRLSKVDAEELRKRFELAWRDAAPKSLIAEYDARG